MAVTAAWLGALLGCAAPPAGPGGFTSTAFATPTQQAPDPAAVWRQLQPLLPADVLLMGEQHDAPTHQQLQRTVVQLLAERGVLAAVALEMAERGTSTAGLPPGAGEQPVREALRWRDASWPWATYGPVVMAAVRAGVPVLGANLPMAELRGAMQSVALDGHLTLESWQKQQQNMRDGHCGLLPERQIVPMARVASRGDTGMIDAYGRWSARGAPADPAKYGPDPEGWRSSIVDARIPAAIAPTPYSNWRDGLFWIILAGLNLGLFVLPRR